MLFALSLLACTDGREPFACRPGFDLAADGHCYPPIVQDIDVEDVLASLPPCGEPATANGAIDLESGCVEAVCVGATEPEITLAMGYDPVCVPTGSATKVYCTWAPSIEGMFADADADAWADPEATNERVHLFPGYTGGTIDGLGIGVPPSCFVDVLGSPDWIAFRDVGGNLLIQDMSWDRYGLNAYDWGWDDGSGVPDGNLDNLYLYGAQ